jgi:ELWxxDGT repeat protein
MYFGAYSDSTYEHWNVYKMGLDGVPHVLVADWDGGNTYPKVGAGAGNSFYFPATDASGDTELWVDDSAGAHLALDITPGGDSFPSGFRSAGTEVCFGAFATVDADWYDLYCVSGISSLAATGVDAGGIGTAGVLTLILGGGLAIVGRRFAIAKR